MSIEVRPLGVRCNLSCIYCYQNPQRDAGNFGPPYDMEKMKKALLAEGGAFALFGGEALLVPKKDLEELWKFGLEHFGHNGIQTNGSLIDEDHIELFKKYRVHVGFSIDGPEDLNDARWAGSLEKTREMTRRSIQNLKRLLDEGISASVIITLHRLNAGSVEKLERLVEWIKEIHSWGVKSIRLHNLELDGDLTKKKLALTPEENIFAFDYLLRLKDEVPGLHVDVFDDIYQMLKNVDDGNATCTWRACDPYTTRAVRGVEGNGQRSNCGRTNKEGIDFFKADEEGFERYYALYFTPQAYGGCEGCRFFIYCKGQCPGTAIDGDWRNKSSDCRLWKHLFEVTESRVLREGITPLTLSPIRPYVEMEMLEAWKRGQNISVGQALRLAAQRLGIDLNQPQASLPYLRLGPMPQVPDTEHGDHWDHTDGREHLDQGTYPSYMPGGHGDHDDHGDHTDDSRCAS